jgi:hypothetical protein
MSSDAAAMEALDEPFVDFRTVNDLLEAAIGGSSGMAGLSANCSQANSDRIAPSLGHQYEAGLHIYIAVLDGLDGFQHVLRLDMTRPQVDNSARWLTGVERKHSEITVVSHYDSAGVECSTENVYIASSSKALFVH